jgi:DNA anti-recombination protein RmuC
MCWPFRHRTAIQVCDPDKIVQEMRKIDTRLALLEKKYEQTCKELTANCQRSLHTAPKFQLLSWLRRRKMLLNRRDSISKQRDELFRKCLDIEQMNITTSQVETLKKTLTVCKTLMSNLNIRDVERLTEDLYDVNQQMNDVCASYEEDSPLLDEVDMDEVEKELRSLSSNVTVAPDSSAAHAEIPSSIPISTQILPLPSAPSHTPYIETMGPTVDVMAVKITV